MEIEYKVLPDCSQYILSDPLNLASWASAPRDLLESSPHDLTENKALRVTEFPSFCYATVNFPHEKPLDQCPDCTLASRSGHTGVGFASHS